MKNMTNGIDNNDLVQEVAEIVGPSTGSDINGDGNSDGTSDGNSGNESSNSTNMNGSSSNRGNNSSTTNNNENHDVFYTPCSSLGSSIVTAVYLDDDGEDNEDNNKQGDENGADNVKTHARTHANIASNSTPPFIATDEMFSSKQETSSLSLPLPLLVPLKHSQLEEKERFKETNKNDSTNSSIKNECKYNMSNTPTSIFLPERQSFKTSIMSKASPLALKSWVALSLTLDGRDKITKFVQYTSRLLGYYYETLAQKTKTYSVIGGTSTSNSSTSNTTTKSQLLCLLYTFKAKRFRHLQKALTTSRKAYRLGRTFIELEKLKSMGLIHWIAWYLRSNMFMDSNSNSNSSDNRKNEQYEHHNGNNGNNHEQAQEGTLGEKGSINMVGTGSVSFHPDTKFRQDVQQDQDQGVQQSFMQDPNVIITTNKETKTKIIPPKIHLPRQISSNIGFKPSFFASSRSTEEKSYIDQLSYIGKLMYRSLSSVIDEEKLITKAFHGKEQQKQQQQLSSPPPPLWKIVSSALKLIGLAGFWAGDNIAYLYTVGFLVDENNSKNTNNGNGTSTSKRGKEAALFATKSYFFACAVGLYLNTREWIRHRNGPFREAMDKVSKLKFALAENYSSNKNNNDDDNNEAYVEHQLQRELDKAKKALEEIRHKHFKICLALLKSCCDVTVFSNNPGVDLHLKYRGHKMNEGIQCVCGITSALTVIYNNYPSLKK